MNSPGELNRITVLDECVDGDESRFDSLIGKDFEEFGIIYDIIKKNSSVLSPDCKCSYNDDRTSVCVKIQTLEENITKLVMPVDKNMDARIEDGLLIVNITVKKEW